MDKKILFEKLAKIIDTGKKKCDIEISLNMPKNCLSAFMLGTKNLPEKWKLKLTEYVNNAENINDVLDSKTDSGSFDDVSTKSYKILCEYCKENNCKIESLIDSHKEKLADGAIKSHNFDNSIAIQEPLNIEDVDFVILKDGMKMRITKDIVIDLAKKYFPNEFKESLEAKSTLTNSDTFSSYQNEINDNLEYKDFLKNDLAPRIRNDSNLTPFQKRDLLFSFGAK